jgi:4-aminobutyrate aminotransferase-like enzyme
VTPVFAAGAYLYDERGQRWLDAGAGNALVGHGHPGVAKAVAAQLTSTSIDGGLRERYIQRLLAKFPSPYSVCYLVNSLSEANELALRLARAHRPGKDAIVLEGASYGMTTSLANMSPAQYESRGIGKKFWVHAASRTDASEVAAKAREIETSGRGLCGFFAEGVFGDGYLRESYASVRADGGLNIAIEAQTGMGRIGKAFWEFARHGVEPDVVVIGESMGNGFPMAALVTRSDLAAPFEVAQAGDVACAAGLAVLDTLTMPGFEMEWRMPVRGSGLCYEIDVKDGGAAVSRLLEERILIARRGNTLLFRPPLTFTRDDASEFLEGLEECG